MYNRITQLLKTSDIVFDIGAYDCKHSILYAAKVQLVCAFEASKKNIIKAQEKLNQTDCNNIQLYHYAVCANDGKALFRDSYGKNCCSGSILAPTAILHQDFPNMYFEEPYAVPAISLDSFIVEHQITPTVLHIDVQGAEFLVLSGITTCKPRLILAEYNTTKRYAGSRPFHEMLIGRGYEELARNKRDVLYQLGYV